MVALRHRDLTGEGQVVDVNLLESMLQMMSALPSAAAHLDYDQPRLGSGIPYSVPRGTYRCADGHWVAISTSAESVAIRVLALLGLAGDERFSSFSVARGAPRRARSHRRRRGSARVRKPRCSPRSRRPRPRSRPSTRCANCSRTRTRGARNVFVEVDGVTMTGPTARLSRTPAHVRHAGRALADGDAAIGWEPREPNRPPQSQRKRPEESW